MNLADLITKQAEWRQKLQAATKEWERQRDGILSEIRICQELIEQAKSGLDDAKILHAEHVIYAGGKFGPIGDDAATVQEAIADIAAGCPKLRHEYFGTKNYDRWTHQRSNHTYGYGPSHGSIVFEIGLPGPVRDRLRNGGELTPEEKDAAIYYLLNLGPILKAKASAKELVA